MSTPKILVCVSALLGIAGLVAACGDDANNDASPPGEVNNPPLEAGPIAEGGGGDLDGGDGGPDGGGPATFPGYVQDLIEKKTNATSAPEGEATWGALPDDLAYKAPPGFF